MTPDLARYVAAGGSLADLCTDVEDTHELADHSCEACRLLDAFSHAPKRARLNEPLPQAQAMAFVATERLRQGPDARAYPTRGPPQA